ncbi:hypothetical protein N2152v2_008282 [Parachlorella kessleri]
MEALARVANVFGCGTCLNMAPVTPRSKPALATPPAAALEEKLILDLAPPNCSMDSRDGNSSQRQESGDENYDLDPQPSWNTTVVCLKEDSPFYQVQQPRVKKSRTRAAMGVELKVSGANPLLGQFYLQDRGRFLPAHPGLVVRRPASASSSDAPM